MANIKIQDLPRDKEVTEEGKKLVRTGFGSFGLTVPETVNPFNPAPANPSLRDIVKYTRAAAALAYCGPPN